MLLLAGVLPLAQGHDDSGSSYPGSDDDDGVSGIYVGSAGLYTTETGGVAATISCDLEVNGGGDSEQAVDETVVDGVQGTGAAQLEDGQWDDGGFGGACHVNQYSHETYNTPGCMDDVARATDAVLVGAVWIGASCDWQTTLGEGFACGADGTSDAANYGPGGLGVDYPGSAFMGSGCSSVDATMQVYIFDSVGGKATTGGIWACAGEFEACGGRVVGGKAARKAPQCMTYFDDDGARDGGMFDFFDLGRQIDDKADPARAPHKTWHDPQCTLLAGGVLDNDESA